MALYAGKKYGSSHEKDIPRHEPGDAMPEAKSLVKLDDYVRGGLIFDLDDNTKWERLGKETQDRIMKLGIRGKLEKNGAIAVEKKAAPKKAAPKKAAK